MLSAIVAALHSLALALGLPSVFLRGRALKGPLDRERLRRLFAADTVWGLAAALWLVTGLLRAFGGLDKGTAFYVSSRLFWLKLALFALVIALEVWPMVTLLRWRAVLRAGRMPDTSAAGALFHLNHVELALIVIIVFVASFMARGFGLRRMVRWPVLSKSRGTSRQPADDTAANLSARPRMTKERSSGPASSSAATFRRSRSPSPSKGACKNAANSFTRTKPVCHPVGTQ